MKYQALFLLFMLAHLGQDQELYVFTEPASNIPAKAIVVRLTNTLMFEKEGGELNYHLLPQVRWGINKKWMLDVQSFQSNRNGGLVIEGGSIYTKYRFLSVDNLQSHFRMAAFGRYSFNSADIHQEEIETVGHNTGYETGLVATQLLHKVAISTSISYEKALDNKPNYEFPTTQSSSALNYTLSIGKLLLPKTYTSYKQTNFNMMLELLGQRLNDNGRSYLDIAPSMQFIINSQARIDVAYRQQLYATMERTAPNGFLLRFEYTFFNVFK